MAILKNTFVQGKLNLDVDERIFLVIKQRDVVIVLCES